MRPIVLKGHERPITELKFNRDSDLLFSASKSTFVNCWYTETGVRLGTYMEHNGAVYGIDVNWTSNLLLSGSSDMFAKLWDVRTGEECFKWKHRVPVRSVNFAHGDKKFLAVTDQVLGLPPMILIYDLAKNSDQQQTTPLLEITGKRPDMKILKALWGPTNKHIYSIHEEGNVCKWDAENGKLLHELKAHRKNVTDFQWSADFGMFITSSADGDAKLWDASTLSLVKTYETGHPVNSAALSPNEHIVVTGGGQSAAAVTTTRVDNTQFHTQVFSKVFAERLARVPGHFGPINCMRFAPDGRHFVSGGEEGYIRLHRLENGYAQVLEKVIEENAEIVSQMTT